MIWGLLKVPPPKKKSYLKTNGYFDKGAIEKHESAIELVKSNSIKKLQEDLDKSKDK